MGYQKQVSVMTYGGIINHHTVLTDNNNNNNRVFADGSPTCVSAC